MAGQSACADPRIAFAGWKRRPFPATPAYLPRDALRRCASPILGLLVLVPAAVAGKPTLDHGVAIHVVERSGIARVADPVTFAVPLREQDAVKHVADLRVLDAAGAEVAAQLRATMRWRGAPDDLKRPIRWLLVDLQIDVAAGGETTYVLARRPAGADAGAIPKPPLSVAASAGVATVDTGVARFRVGGERMTLFDRVWVDLDGDGDVADDEVLLDGPLTDGFTLLDRFGASYASAQHAHQLTVEEAGPLRTVLRIDGRHAPLPIGSGIGRDFFQYRTRVTFYAGKPYARVVHTLRNAYLDAPLGSIGFEGYRFDLALVDPVGLSANFGTAVGSAAAFAAQGALRLYQDSAGGDHWDAAPDTTFPGYRITDAADQVVAAGQQAGGFVHVGGSGRGVTVAMRWFFENFPKGFAFDGDRRLRFDLFPAEFAAFHWLDDGQQKTTDFMVYAHGANSEPPGQVARRFQEPLQPYCTAGWIRATRAFGDQGDLAAVAGTPAELYGYEQSQLDWLYENAFNQTSYAFGWSEFGEFIWAKNTHTTGSPRNKLTYFDRFAITGALPAFRVPELFALHSRDLRTYHIDGFTQEGHPWAVLWEGLPVWNFSADKLGRDALDPALAAHRAGIPEYGHGWNGCDFEHMVVDDLFEYYLMTGDPVSFDALRELGECVRTFPIYDGSKPPGPTRGVGWTLRALMKIHQVTGDPRFLATANQLVAAVDKTHGKQPSALTGIVYRYIFAHPPVASHIADAPFDMPWQLAVTIHGFLLHHRETGSKKSRKLALHVADYLVKYCWNGVAMNEAVAVTDHQVVNPKTDNEGVNTWIPSALALAWREKPKLKYLKFATQMVESIPPTFLKWDHFLGWSGYHWWHSYLAVKAVTKQVP